MQKKKNILGIKKYLLNTKIKIFVFFHYLPLLVSRRLSLKRFILLLKRLLFFLGRIRENKYVKIGKITKLDLYVPGFPSQAFYSACDKFKEFEKKMPCTTVLISTTSACRFNCNHCYQKKDKGKDVDIKVLSKTVKRLQDEGIAFYNIEGGDPFLAYDRLYEICMNIDRRSEIWINSTGDGITDEKLAKLKKSNIVAIMFSLHESERDQFNLFMGNNDAWDILLKGIEICHKNNIGVAINTCLKKDGLFNGKFEKIMKRAKLFNACLIQVIVPKPSGGWLGNRNETYPESDTEKLKHKVYMYNNDKRYKEYPSISAQAIEEDSEHFGCTAGGTDRFYINAKGDVQPCEFLNISCGNIQEDDFPLIYNRMRKIFEKPCEDLMCEKISKEVYKYYRDNKLKSLPLDVKLSKQITIKWDRGNETEFYKKIKNMK